MATRLASGVRPPSRPDASMSLITDLFANPIDEGYAEAARQRATRGTQASAGEPPRSPAVLMLGTLALGLLLGVAALQGQQNAGIVSAERESLVERIELATEQVDALERDLSGLERDIVEIEASRLNSLAVGNELRESIATTQAITGTRPVTGPGVVVEVADAEGGVSNTQTSVLDLDIQQVVNGLWAAGAEAVAVNGQRITALTAIRSANDVILVNFRPLSSPYQVRAIGDARTLGSRFLEGSGGAWLLAAASTAGIQFDVRNEQSLTLPAASAALRLAKPGEVS
ncbi:MAG TPA: DUF881 domain-containing protein [Jiangellaceae bacterium]|nr:DUF881 domain-containing protein [Jiangellaceae bacterium]